ncbi:hypothetical protein NDU88_009059 [Pleurodeles waltl]|uniref:Uncharacterized protein n=1 Tax=Pleurodeles waltl TaxID=8319 RepID=A0AAV7RZF2_PLEWA|nr:hypothetical protein NDU88_009059 [Pleurodeles waltl]
MDGDHDLECGELQLPAGAVSPPCRGSHQPRSRRRSAGNLVPSGIREHERSKLELLVLPRDLPARKTRKSQEKCWSSGEPCDARIQRCRENPQRDIGPTWRLMVMSRHWEHVTDHRSERLHLTQVVVILPPVAFSDPVHHRYKVHLSATLARDVDPWSAASVALLARLLGLRDRELILQKMSSNFLETSKVLALFDFIIFYASCCFSTDDDLGYYARYFGCSAEFIIH